MIETLVGPAEPSSELVAPRTAMTVHQRGRALVGDDALTNGTIYPPVSTLRPVARTIAEALFVYFRDAGYGRQLRDEQVADAVDRAMWRPEYLEYSAG